MAEPATMVEPDIASTITSHDMRAGQAGVLAMENEFLDQACANPSGSGVPVNVDVQVRWKFTPQIVEYRGVDLRREVRIVCRLDIAPGKVSDNGATLESNEKQVRIGLEIVSEPDFAEGCARFAITKRPGVTRRKKDPFNICGDARTFRIRNVGKAFYANRSCVRVHSELTLLNSGVNRWANARTVYPVAVLNDSARPTLRTPCNIRRTGMLRSKKWCNATTEALYSM